MPPENEPGTGNPNLTGDPAPNPASWTATLDAETQGYFQNRGWHDKTPAEVAVLASKAHREAEKYIGAPSDQILRLPKATDGQEAWKPVYERLGKPTDPKDYDFTAVKFADGSAPDQADVDYFRGVADKLNLSKAAAVELAQSIATRADANAASDAAERQATNIKGQEALKQSWGANYSANEFIANQAAAKLGLGADVLQTMASVVGGEKVAQALLQIGLKTGEDRFVTNQNPANPGTFTREQAVSQKADLMRDKGFTDRLLAGDVDANKQMMSLNEIITSGEG